MYSPYCILLSEGHDFRFGIASWGIIGLRVYSAELTMG